MSYSQTVLVQKTLNSCVVEEHGDECLSVDLRSAELDRCTQLFNGCRLSEDILALRHVATTFNCSVSRRIWTAVTSDEHPAAAELHYPPQ